MPKPTTLVPSRTILSSFSLSLASKTPVTARQSPKGSHRALSTTQSLTTSRPRTQCLQTSLHTKPLGSKTTQSQARTYKTVQEARSRYRSGPFSALAGLLFLSSGAGLIFYFRYEKARMERKRVAEAAKGVGRPKVGGEFELVDQFGKQWGSEKMKGRYSLVYFGFSHCPDICPEELDKMAQMIDLVNASPLLSSPTPAPSSSSSPATTTPQNGALPPLLPLFITCDPARDTPAVLREYLSEFHPAIIGLTGTWEQIKDVCKKYRVYFSTPSGVKKGEDYLVDHSIYFYLMDPEGDFVEAIGRQHSPQVAAEIILAHVGDWAKEKR